MDEEAVVDVALRSSKMVRVRFAAGMRWIRRSRRDWRLAHWASQAARSFSLRESTVEMC